ncbi:MAG: prepilin-type N-terminal cleavage/methylation domain-containing protein [Endomicrobium sp.]|jgi:prepilin-type N-terminal cleavage/methylation domain-containing protein|nr:prepilin-type N-terminal cleavage/methylation domain-containing protein [Endomicrobium sp.]
MKKSVGFTLVEFIIVLVMIGILGIIAISIYKKRTVKNQALKVDTYEDIQSQETPLEEVFLGDCLKSSDKAFLVNK